MAEVTYNRSLFLSLLHTLSILLHPTEHQIHMLTSDVDLGLLKECDPDKRLSQGILEGEVGIHPERVGECGG